MKKLLVCILSFFCVILAAENVQIFTQFYFTPEETKEKSIEDILKQPETRHCFSANLTAAKSSIIKFAFQNRFAFRNVGFFGSAQSSSTEKPDFQKIEMQYVWELAPEGPVNASGLESFDDGVEISSAKKMRKDLLIPSGLFKNRKGDSYIPLISRTELPETESSVWARNASVIITVQLISGAKVRFRVTNTRETKGRVKINQNGVSGTCSISAHGKVACIKLDLSRKVGVRADKEDILEKISLEQYVYLPPKGKTVPLAEFISFCSRDEIAFAALPPQKPVVCKVFLTME